MSLLLLAPDEPARWNRRSSWRRLEDGARLGYQHYVARMRQDCEPRGGKGCPDYMDTLMEPVAVGDLQQVRRLYYAGQYLQAYEAARALGPFPSWEGPLGRTTAVRLAGQLGGNRMARVLIRLAHREYPDDLDVRYYFAHYLVRRRGPLRTMWYLRSHPCPPDASTSQQTDWLSLTASISAVLRDFDAAQDLIRQALGIAPERAWLWTEQGFVLASMDRRDEALASYERALQLQPWFRPAVEAKADSLLELGDDAGAEAFLREATARLECGGLVARLAALLTELSKYDEARELYERCETYYPLRDKEFRDWLNARSADAAYYCGDFQRARELAVQVDSPFFQNWSKRLAESLPADKRVQLPVAFVRQHHLTCAPATLAALSRFWDMPADHLELAEKICYDGTPGHSERRWAEERGYEAREMAVNWPTATALLDRGVPFTLETRTAISGHLQAIVGYDSRRGTLLIRDPGERHTNEFFAESLFEDLASVGPRGMVFVPRPRAELLAGIALPEVELFDRYHELQCALADHRRDAAQQACEAMQRLAPDGRLTLVARRTLCYYDGDTHGALAITEQLLARYPQDHRLIHERLHALDNLGRSAERREALAKLCSGDRQSVVFWREYGEELAKDARRHEEAVRWLQRAAEVMGPDAATYFSLATIYWDQGRREEAMPLFRWAACIEDKTESYAKSYFIAARHLKDVERVLAWLRRRFERYGHKSAGPAVTLSWALSELDRDEESLEVLDAAIAKRPEDGWLLTYTAERKGWLQRHDEAQELMARAATCTYRGAWLRAAANLADARGDVAESLRAWRELAQLEPLNTDAHSTVYELTRATEGDQAALDYIRDVAARHSRYVPVQQLLLLKLRGADVNEAIAVARRALELHPDDGWTRRELFQLLAMQGDVVSAMAEANAAVELEPSAPSSFACRGHLLANLGQRDKAREDYRQALRLSVDFEPAIDGLLGLCDSREDRLEALRFIAGECRGQTTFGDGVFAFTERAHQWLPGDELLEFAREGHAARPDLWHTWAALAGQLRRTESLDESRDIAAAATEQFPFVPRLWLEMARAHQAAGNPEAQIEALRKALAISPAWGLAAQELSEAYERIGQPEPAQEVLEHVLRRAPQDAITRGFLADLLWRLERRDEAIEHLKQACRLSASYDWAWNTLREWLATVQRANELTPLARELAALRPGNAYAWFRLSDTLVDRDADSDEALTALDRAIALDPGYVEAHSRRAERLADLGRFDEALAATHPPNWSGWRPVQLRAWEGEILGRREDREGAIHVLRDVLTEAPDYGWACYRLTDYLWQAERWQECAEAAARLVELEPHYAMGWGYLGDARRRLGERPAAREAFAKSFEASKDYDFGARSLAEMQLEDGDLAAARAVIDELHEHGSNSYSLVMSLRIELAQHGARASLKDLESLARCDSDAPDGFKEGGKLLHESPVRENAVKALIRFLDLEGVNPLIGLTWIDAAGIGWDTLWQLLRLKSQGPAWQVAVSRFAELAATQKGALKVYVLTRLRRAALGVNVRTWGSCGYALASNSWYRAARKWLQGWDRREDILPWVICNAAYAEWMCGHDREAQRASRLALDMPPDHSRHEHLTLLATTTLTLDGDAGTASRRLEEMPQPQVDGTYRAIHDIVSTACQQILQAAIPERVGFETAVATVRAAIKRHDQLPRSDRGIVSYVAMRCLELLAKAYQRPWQARWYALCRLTAWR